MYMSTCAYHAMHVHIHTHIYYIHTSYLYTATYTYTHIHTFNAYFSLSVDGVSTKAQTALMSLRHSAAPRPSGRFRPRRRRPSRPQLRVSHGPCMVCLCMHTLLHMFVYLHSCTLMDIYKQYICIHIHIYICICLNTIRALCWFQFRVSGTSPYHRRGPPPHRRHAHYTIAICRNASGLWVLRLVRAELGGVVRKLRDSGPRTGRRPVVSSRKSVADVLLLVHVHRWNMARKTN